MRRSLGGDGEGVWMICKLLLMMLVPWVSFGAPSYNNHCWPASVTVGILTAGAIALVVKKFGVVRTAAFIRTVLPIILKGRK